MKNIVVVDSSVAIKWVLEEPDSYVAQELLDDWIDKEKVVLAPTLLAYEITNIIYKNVRRGGITLERAKEALTEFFDTEVTYTTLQEQEFSQRAIELTHQFSLLATYDAYFLVLAEHEDCELWTADMRLWNAVKGKLSWVHLLSNYHSNVTEE